MRSRTVRWMLSDGLKLDGGGVFVFLVPGFSGGADETGLRRKDLIGGGMEVFLDACSSVHPLSNTCVHVSSRFCSGYGLLLGLALGWLSLPVCGFLFVVLGMFLACLCNTCNILFV
ncbi:unnamed protein product [Brassica rapa subsp. trilocularis]